LDAAHELQRLALKFASGEATSDVKGSVTIPKSECPRLLYARTKT